MTSLKSTFSSVCRAQPPSPVIITIFMLAGVEAFLEENGQLMLEAESGNLVAGSTHDWVSQTTQSNYAGSAYLRALPDVGQP